MDNDSTPREFGALSEVLGPLPDAAYDEDCTTEEPTYTADQMRAYALQERAAERERWKAERKDYRSLLMQARVILRGPHTEQNILVRELIARIEARGVHFGA
jgi:hypothetical protein